MAEAIRVPWKVLVALFRGGVSKRFAFFAIALGLILLVAIWWVFDVLPSLLVDGGRLIDNERLQRENDVRTTGLQALAAGVLAIGGAFTAYSVLSTREGQLDERFARALELLSSEDTHVVRGAVFSLERIALQSRFDRPAVVDVLSGFVRAGAPLSLDGKEKPRSEVMDALRVIGRINQVWPSPKPSLQKTCWEGVPLPTLDLSGSLLAGSVFEGTILVGTKFRKANLFDANFAGALPFNANFSKAYLYRADLSKMTLLGVNLRGAELRYANLTGADFSGAKIRGADFTGANLAEADLRSSNLRRVASLNGAKYTAETLFPKDFDPQEHGMVLKETPLKPGEVEAGGAEQD